MNALKRKAAILVGIVFVVSGLLKLMDPSGTMLIVTEYFKFLHLSVLAPISRPLGIVLSLTESAVGIALITGVVRKVSALITYCLLGFFTLVTLLLWIKNPVMDCGCFGEAIHLSHAQSFLKNVILLALSVLAFTPLHALGTPKPYKYVSACIGTLAVLVACVYSNTHLPLLEFTDYKPGTELFAALDEDTDASVLAAAPMLSIRNAEGEYVDELATIGPVVLLSVYDASEADWTALQQQYQEAEAIGAIPIVVAASYPAEVAPLNLPLPVHFGDYRTLISLNRSNGGGTYFQDGELVYKWKAGRLPSHLSDEIQEDPTAVSTRHTVRRRLLAEGFSVGLAAVLLLI